MNNHVNNPDLSLSLMRLTRQAGAIYRRSLGPVGDSAAQLRAYLHFEVQVRALDAFQRSVDILANDQTARELLGQLVGPRWGSRATITSFEDCVTAFVQQYWLVERQWSAQRFNWRYARFEELFYSPVLWVRESSRLHNFVGPARETRISDEVVVRKSPLNRAAIFDFGRGGMLASEFVLERTSAQPKVVGMGRAVRNADGHVDAQVLFDDVMKALRLSVSSPVYRDSAIETELLSFHPLAGRSTRTPWGATGFMGRPFRMTRSRASAIRRLHAAIQAEPDGRFRIALDRLSFGMERYRLEDRIIDYMVALEALYLPNADQELSLRLALRLARTLSRTRVRRTEMFVAVRAMYDARSRIVHGERPRPNVISRERVAALEEVVRQSLKVWLLDPERFSPATLDGIVGP